MRERIWESGFRRKSQSGSFSLPASMDIACHLLFPAKGCGLFPREMMSVQISTRLFLQTVISSISFVRILKALASLPELSLFSSALYSDSSIPRKINVSTAFATNWIAVIRVFGIPCSVPTLWRHNNPHQRSPLWTRGRAVSRICKDHDIQQASRIRSDMVKFGGFLVL